MSARNIAIIPARGGSKRIPRKNIKSFLGKPILAYSIEAALQSNLFDAVMVSTDDSAIANVARKYGAQVPFMRSAKNSDDFATTMDVLQEVLTVYGNEHKQRFDYGCCLYPTAPLMQIEQLKAGFKKLQDGNFDTVFPITPFSYPIWRGVEIEDGKTKMLWPENLSKRSQDLKKVYHDAGQWYWFTCKRPLSSLFTDNSASIILEENEVQDIDTLTDWTMAELKYKSLHED